MAGKVFQDEGVAPGIGVAQEEDLDTLHKEALQAGISALVDDMVTFILQQGDGASMERYSLAR